MYIFILVVVLVEISASIFRTKDIPKTLLLISLRISLMNLKQTVVIPSNATTFLLGSNKNIIRPSLKKKKLLKSDKIQCKLCLLYGIPYNSVGDHRRWKWVPAILGLCSASVCLETGSILTRAVDEGRVRRKYNWRSFRITLLQAGLHMPGFW